MATTRKRDRLHVIHDILKSIQEKDGKIRPTHILYKSNLSHQMMDEYIKDLIEGNFIRENKTKDGKTYSLENKGFEFLAKYKTVTEFLEAFGLN